MALDKYRIDSHKLIYHPERVADWLRGISIYPIYVEISLSNACNHRCNFCAYDYLDYKAEFADVRNLESRLDEMGSLGIKSILYSGEGEPLLHKNAIDVIDRTKRAGIDSALSSNGVLLTSEKADSLLKNLSWIRVSLNAGTSGTYAKIHNTNAADFNRVIENLAYACELRRRNNYDCALGIQMLLLPENADEVEELTCIAKNIGVDYLVVKPYSHHFLSKTTAYMDISYDNYRYLADGLINYNDENFQVIVRTETMINWDNRTRRYSNCMALPFWCHIDTGGNVWACAAYITDNRFNLGNITERSLKEIWDSKQRQELNDWAKNELATTECRVNCRMDKINSYLWELINPIEHVNFI